MTLKNFRRAWPAALLYIATTGAFAQNPLNDGALRIEEPAHGVLSVGHLGEQELAAGVGWQAPWRSRITSLDQNPGALVSMAVLPRTRLRLGNRLLVQGGQPGSLVCVGFEVVQGQVGFKTILLGAARFDGGGQARVPLGRRAMPEGRLQAWVGGSSGSWWPGPSITLGGTTLAEAVAASRRPVQSGELVISEIMKDPARVPDTAGEWVELFNTTWMRQDIEGFTLTDDAGHGTILTNGGHPVWVHGRGYRVLARNADSGANGGITGALDYATFSMRNGADQVILARPDGTVVDRISYDDGIEWPDVSGTSMQLRIGTESPFQNDSGAFWCESTAIYGIGDMGTPGLPNEDC